MLGDQNPLDGGEPRSQVASDNCHLTIVRNSDDEKILGVARIAASSIKQKDLIHKTVGEMVCTYEYVNKCVEKIYREEENKTSSCTTATQ
eukprot:7370669-Ditylum_brightwellii.AAC.1